MTTKNAVKRLGLTALALVLGLGTAQAADPNSANNTGTFIVRITPNVDLGVTVDTTGAAWITSPTSLDTSLDLNTTDKLGTSVKLTVAGDFNNQELLLSAAANDTWQLDTADETPNTDQVNLYAKVGAYQATPPSDITGTTDLLTGTPTRAGQVQADEAGDTNRVYEFSSATEATQYADVDGMSVGNQRGLWLKMRTPPYTSTDAQQSFTVTVTAVTGTGL